MGVGGSRENLSGISNSRREKRGERQLKVHRDDFGSRQVLAVMKKGRRALLCREALLNDAGLLHQGKSYVFISFSRLASIRSTSINLHPTRIPRRSSGALRSVETPLLQKGRCNLLLNGLELYTKKISKTVIDHSDPWQLRCWKKPTDGPLAEDSCVVYKRVQDNPRTALRRCPAASLVKTGSHA